MLWEATSYWMGEFLPAREHLEKAITLYDPERHRPLAFRYGGVDAGVVCLCRTRPGLCGSSAIRTRLSSGAMKRSRWLKGCPIPLVWLLRWYFVGILRQFRREARAAQENAESMIALSAEHGFTDFLAYATVLRGWAMAEQGRNEEGIAQIQEGMAAFRATGGELVRPYFLVLAGRGVHGGGPPR